MSLQIMFTSTFYLPCLALTLCFSIDGTARIFTWNMPDHAIHRVWIHFFMPPKGRENIGWRRDQTLARALYPFLLELSDNVSKLLKNASSNLNRIRRRPRCPSGCWQCRLWPSRLFAPRNWKSSITFITQNFIQKASWRSVQEVIFCFQHIKLR